MTLNQKLSEMAEKAHDKIDDKLALKWEFVEAYKAGAKAALELPEVKALVTALEFYSLKSNYSLVDEGRNYSVEYKCYEVDEKTYGDIELGTKAQEALTTWKQFKGEENGVNK